MDLKAKILGLFLEETDQFLKVIKHRREELKDLSGSAKFRAMKRLDAAEKAWKDGDTEQALKWKNDAEDIIGGKDTLKAANTITSSPTIDKIPNTVQPFSAIKDRPEQVMSKFGKSASNSISHDDRQLPSGVTIPKADEDDIVEPPIVGGIATAARGRTESNLLDTEKQFQNIKTNLSRIQGDLPDVKRLLQTQPQDLEKFNADYDKIKYEVLALESEWNVLKTQELSKEAIKDFSSRVKKLAFKISMYFGNSFYAIKKLKTKHWNFSDVPIKKPEASIEAPPIEPVKPIETPKATSPEDDWNKKLDDAGMGDADNPDHDLELRDRHSDNDLDENYESIKETIRNCFKL